MLPNYIIVGAEKAGTTTLAEMVGMHPDVFMSDPKEPRYFSDLGRYKGLEWYESLFDGAEGCRAIGEASTAYSFYPLQRNVPKRIYELLGDIKYIYIVRHPIERIISEFRHAKYLRWIPDEMTIDEAIDADPRIVPASYYHLQVQQYLEYTKKDQWHILSLEDLTAHPEETMKEIFRFLEIDDSVTIELAQENMVSVKKRMPIWYQKLKKNKHLCGLFQKKGGMAALKDRVKGYIGKPVEQPPVLSPSIRERLVADLLPDSRKFSEFCGRDFVREWKLDVSISVKNNEV